MDPVRVFITSSAQRDLDALVPPEAQTDILRFARDLERGSIDRGDPIPGRWPYRVAIVSGFLVVWRPVIDVEASRISGYQIVLIHDDDAASTIGERLDGEEDPRETGLR